MNYDSRNTGAHKNLCKRNLFLKPLPLADPTCVAGGANQCPPTTSITALGSAPRSHYWPAATQSVLSLNALSSDDSFLVGVSAARERSFKKAPPLSNIGSMSPARLSLSAVASPHGRLLFHL